jgi:hypothetical protein
VTKQKPPFDLVRLREILGVSETAFEEALRHVFPEARRDDRYAFAVFATDAEVLRIAEKARAFDAVERLWRNALEEALREAMLPALGTPYTRLSKETLQRELRKKLAEHGKIFESLAISWYADDRVEIVGKAHGTGLDSCNVVEIRLEVSS